MFSSKQCNLFMLMQNSPRPRLAKSASSNVLSLPSRKFLVFSTFLLTLLLCSSLFRASSYLPTYDPELYHGAFTGRRFLSTGAILLVRTTVDEERHAARIRDEALYCDRSHERTDVCVAKGDVRVVGDGEAGSYEVVVFAEGGQEREEKIKPYTRKWEESVMKTIDEVKIIRKVVINSANLSDSDAALQLPEDHLVQQLQGEGRSSFTRRHRDQSMKGHQQKESAQVRPDHQEAAAAALQQKQGTRSPTDHSPVCEVQHEVPAILFSTGGYTGNVYHEFNDGLIPLFITAQKYSPGQVVLIFLEYHDWWISKYAEVVSQITNYTVIDLAHDKRVHCFPEVTVGLRIHDELAIHADHAATHHDHASMEGFQSLLHAAYLPRLRMKAEMTTAVQESAPTPLPAMAMHRPKLVIISRSSPRALLNQQQVIALAEEIGFSVEVLSPKPTTEMVDIYWALSTCDVMLGVHGAAMTHLLFMRPGATFIQVVPLGTDWAATTYYGEPAQKMGLNYVEYKVSPTESSLSEKYASDDPVLLNPDAINSKGWRETKRIYLEGQDVTISLARMGGILRAAHGLASATPL